MTDRAFDRRKAQAQRPFHLVHLVVHVRDFEHGLDEAMEIDDLSVVGCTHAYVMDLADEFDLGRDLDQRVAHRRDALGWRVATGLIEWLQRLDMRFDLDTWAQLLADGLFESSRDVVRLADGDGAVDLEIERNRKSSADRVHDDVVSRERAVARNHHDALERRLVVERARVRGYGHFGGGTVGAYCLEDALFERRHTVERQRAADRNLQIDEQYLAHLPHTQPLDSDDAWNAGHGGSDFPGGSGRRGIGQRIDSTSAEPPTGDADH